MPIFSTLGALTQFKPTSSDIISYWYIEHFPVYGNGTFPPANTANQSFTTVATDSKCEYMTFLGAYTPSNIGGSRPFIVAQKQLNFTSYDPPTINSKSYLSNNNSGSNVTVVEYNEKLNNFTFITNNNRVYTSNVNGTITSPNFNYTAPNANIRNLTFFDGNITIVGSYNSGNGNVGLLMNYTNTVNISKTFTSNINDIVVYNNNYILTGNSVFSVNSNANSINWQINLYEPTFAGNSNNIITTSLVQKDNFTFVLGGATDNTSWARSYIIKLDSDSGNIIWSKYSSTLVSGGVPFPSANLYFSPTNMDIDKNKNILILSGFIFDGNTRVSTGMTFIDGNSGNTIVSKNIDFLRNPPVTAANLILQDIKAVPYAYIATGTAVTSGRVSAWAIKLPSDGSNIGNGYYPNINEVPIGLPGPGITITYETTNVSYDTANVTSNTANITITDTPTYNANSVSTTISSNIVSYYIDTTLV